MKYSLIHKFQGAYLGCCIGKLLSSNQRKQSLIQEGIVPILNPIPSSVTADDNRDINTNLILQDLVDNLDNNLVVCKKYFFQNQALTISNSSLNFLPWILLYHDNWDHLQYLLALVGEQNNFKDEDRELIEFWLDGIVLSLTEKLDIKNPIQQIIRRKKLQYSCNLEQIQLIELALFRGQTSKQLLELLLTKTNNSPRIELLFSLYLFLSIPEDFSLIIKRANSVSQKFPHMLGLTGTLAGAYNSIEGISPHWLNLYQSQYSKGTNISTENTPHSYQGTIDDFAMIKKLFSFWSGVYDYDISNSKSLVIAIPNSFQPRADLKIVSQQEYRSN